MSFFKDKPVRNKAYLKWVASLPCSHCGAPSDEAHHIIGVGEGGMATKACDLLTMPVCRPCHTEIHNHPRHWPEQWHFVAKTLQQAIKEGVISVEK